MPSPAAAPSPFPAWAYPVLAGALMLGLWYGVIALFAFEPWLLPPPHAVLAAFWIERGPLGQALWTTFLGSSLGFLLAAAAGGLGSLALALSLRLRRAFYPYVLLMQMVPVIVTAALIVTMLDVGLPSVVLIAFLICFFPMVASTLAGLLSVPVEQQELFRLYGASRRQELLWLRLPHALPAFFTGLQISATLAVIGSVTGEIFAGSTRGGGGLGFMVIVYKTQLKTEAVFAAACLAILLGFVYVSLVNFCQRKLLPWRAPQA